MILQCISNLVHSLAYTEPCAMGTGCQVPVYHYCRAGDMCIQSSGLFGPQTPRVQVAALEGTIQQAHIELRRCQAVWGGGNLLEPALVLEQAAYAGSATDVGTSCRACSAAVQQVSHAGIVGCQIQPCASFSCIAFQNCCGCKKPLWLPSVFRRLSRY